MSKKKLAKRARRRKNPSNITKLATDVGAGVAGYASVRLASRIGFAQAVKRWPNAAKHVHAASAAASAAGVFFGTKHWSKVEDYHDAATIGAGIALFQTVVQTYLPQFGWIVSDVNADQYAAKPKQQQQQAPADLTNMLLENPDYDPYADMTPQMPVQQPKQLPAQPAQGDFNLDQFLRENPDVEAAEIGQAPAAPDYEGLPGDVDGMSEFDNTDDLDDVLHTNGMMH